MTSESDEPDTGPVTGADGPTMPGSAYDCLHLLDAACASLVEPGRRPDDDADGFDWLVIDEDEAEGPDDASSQGGNGGVADAGGAAPTAAVTANSSSGGARIAGDGEPGDAAVVVAPADAEFNWLPRLGEIVAIHVALLLAEALLGRPGFGWQGVDPHPYLFAVAAIAGLRGLVAGLLMAAVSTAVAIAGALDAGTLFDLVWWRGGAPLQLPIAWFLLAFVAGHPRDLLLGQCRELLRQQQRQAADRRRAQQRIDRLITVNQRLKIRLLDHTAQFGNLIDNARKVEAARGGELFTVALDMIVEHCGASRCSVLQVEGSTLGLLASRGTSDADQPALLAAARSSPLVQAAVARAQRGSGFDSSEPPAQGPLVVAPVTGKDGSIAAVLCIDEIPAERFQQDVASILFSIAAWVEVVLRRDDGRERVPDAAATTQELLRPRPWIGTPQALALRLRQEDVRAERLGMPSSLLSLQAVMVAVPDELELAKLDQFLATSLLHGLLRESDALYRFGAPGCYVVVLPATSANDAETARRRISRRLNLERFGGVQLFELATFGVDARHPGLSDCAPAIAAQFHKAVDRPIASFAIETPKPGIGDAQAFARHLRLELHLAIRHRTELYLVELRLGEARAVTEVGLDALVGQIGLRLLSPADSAYRLAPGRYVLLLPGIDNEAVFLIAQQWEAALRTALVSPGPKPSTEVYALGNYLAESNRLTDRLLARQLARGSRLARVEA